LGFKSPADSYQSSVALDSTEWSGGQTELSPHTDYLREAFRGQKVRIALKSANQLSPATADKAGEILLAEGTRLTALIDNRCASSMEPISGAVVTAEDRHEVLPIQAYNLTLTESMDLDDLINRANTNPCLIGITEYGEISIGSVPNDPLFSISAHHGVANLNTGDAWDLFYDAERGIRQDVIIAVIDTGIRRTHQDLAANIWLNANGENGFDFINNDADPSDDNGHGTHCAGIIGAVANNTLGGSGVMGMRVKLMGVKVMDSSGSGSFAALANGINYAVQNGARVLNLSLGTSIATGNPDQDLNPIVTAAIQNAAASGVTVVIAAGNDNMSLDQSLSYPANQGKRFAGVITVGALDTVDRTRSAYSNYSTTAVEIFAPGSESSKANPSVGVLSTHHAADNAYARLHGTSMAAPMVAGAAGLAIGAMISNGINPSAAQIENLIHGTAPSNANLNGLGKGAKHLSLQTLATHIYSPPARIVPVGPSLWNYFVQRFDEHAESADWYLNVTDRESSFAEMTVNQGDVLNAFLTMYEATRDQKYLQKFVRHADRIMSFRDDQARFTDWKGESNAVWSNGYDPYLAIGHEDKQYAAAVETGNLIYPLARFAFLVRQSGPDIRGSMVTPRSPSEDFETLAGKYLTYAIESFNYHFRWYSMDRQRGFDIGWYFAEPFGHVSRRIAPGKPLPMNWQASMGRATIMIYKAGNFSAESSPYQASLRLCNYFLLEMEYQSDESYAWRGWPTMRYYPPGHVVDHDFWQHYGHSYIDLEFMALCNRHIGVFHATEMGRLSRTISGRIFTSAYQFRYDLGPNPTSSNVLQYEGLSFAGLYFPFASTSPGLERLIYDALITYGQIHHSLTGYPGTYGAGTSLRSLAEVVAFYRQ